MTALSHQCLKPRGALYGLWIAALVIAAVAGLYCAYTMEHAGHHITGMTNRVVWGLPHVFAVSLIVAASGALNAASMASVFNVSIYKPYSRCSVALAISLLIGGVMVLVLDLGRPDRLIVAVTHFNFRSVFSWNVFLYTGFLLLCIVYLWFLCERRYQHQIKRIGLAALVWRIMLTTGTGCIFGFLVGRNSLDSALLAPMFIVLSLVTGTAALALCLLAIARSQQNPLPVATVRSLSTLMIWFVAALGYFAIVHHLTNLYVAEHAASERLVLGGSMAALFWIGFVTVGLAGPLLLLMKNLIADTDADYKTQKRRLQFASAAALIGGASLVYVIIIGSQVSAQRLFPGKTVLASSFGDVGNASYQPSLWEWGLGFGGVAVGLLIFQLLLRLFPFTADRQHS